MNRTLNRLKVIFFYPEEIGNGKKSENRKKFLSIDWLILLKCSLAFHALNMYDMLTSKL